jgi:hypothetical protein
MRFFVMADEREVTLPGELSVLTWGSDIYENPYRDPIRKKLQGSNLGHGAFLLNLPDTPENKAAFERLMALGYPGDIVKVPKVVEALDTLNDQGEPIRKTVPNEFDNRYFIRFSPYFYSFGSAQSDGFMQKYRHEILWDEERFEALKSDVILKAQDLKNLKMGKKPKEKKSIINELLSQLDTLFNEALLKDFFLEKGLSEEKATKCAQQVESLLREKYAAYFEDTFKESFANLDEEEKTRRVEKLVDQVMQDRPYSAFKKEPGEVYRNPMRIVHLERLKNLDPSFWEETANEEAAEMIYQSYGKPPDRVAAIPLKNEQFQYGLDFLKVAKEMEKIKIKANAKLYKHILKNENEEDKTNRKEIEAKLIEEAKNAGMQCSEKPDINELFNALIYLKDYLEQAPQNDEAQEAVADFDALWKGYFLKAYDDDIFIQDTLHEYTFNCCRWTKDCIRAGLDSAYQGYLSEPLVIGTLTPPAELANESNRLESAIRKDRNTQLKSDKDATFTQPPFLSRVKGIGLSLQNHNYTLLPSRTLIRPAIALGGAALGILKAPFSLVSRFFGGKPAYAPSTASLSEREVALVKSKKINMDSVLKKVMNFNSQTQYFLIDSTFYQDVLHAMNETHAKKYGYNTVDELRQAFIKKYGEIQRLAFNKLNETPMMENRKKPIIYGEKTSKTNKPRKAEASKEPLTLKDKGKKSNLKIK